MGSGYVNKWHQLALLGLAAILLLSFWAGLWYQGRRLSPAVSVYAEVMAEREGDGQTFEDKAGMAEGENKTSAGGDPAGQTPGIETVDENFAEAGPGMLGIHVVGQVRQPGVYYLAEGSRVNDAVLAAQPLEDANLGRLNLALPLQDGLQIRVPKIGADGLWPEGQLIVSPEEAMEDKTLLSGAAAYGGNSAVLDINRADQRELEILPGIGPALAARIIADRKDKGPFKSLEELDRVKGIGAALIREIQGLAVCGP